MADVTSLLRAPAIEPPPTSRIGWRARSWVAAAHSHRPRAAQARVGQAAATWAGWLTEVPFAVQAVAAALALVVTAGLVMAAGSAPGAPARPRFGQRISDATVYVRRAEGPPGRGLPLLRVVVSTAFEGRLDRVNDRVEDYRRLLEQRKKDEPRAGRQEVQSEESEPRSPAARRSE
jgi:hypothetical protein